MRTSWSVTWRIEWPQADVGRVPILRRADGRHVGLVARRDLLRVRANAVRQEREREVLLRFRTPQRSAG